MTGTDVSLDDMLNAREARAIRQHALFERHKTALLSFTLNIAGAKKRFPLADRCFAEGIKAIAALLEQHHITVLECMRTDEATGLEYLAALSAPPLDVKKLFAALEEEHPLGRLFDIDVLFENAKIDRSSIGYKERSCLVCGLAGAYCARSRKHSAEELWQTTNALLEAFFTQKDSHCIAQIAVRALLYELAATPKPGLVDRSNSGAHTDMNFFTFLDSAVALYPYFQTMFVLGAKNKQYPAENLLPILRSHGIRAEKSMSDVTGGVNTHKGAIFSLGLVSAACGYLGIPLPPSDAILRCASEIALPALQEDFTHAKKSQAQSQALQTHGEAAFLQHGITGIRGEAANAFPSVRKYGLPTLERALRQGSSVNDAGVEALFAILAYADDTNIIRRGGLEMLGTVRQSLNDFSIEQAAQFDAWFIEKNISPGGCADLLAVTYMMYLLGQLNKGVPE